MCYQQLKKSLRTPVGNLTFFRIWRPFLGAENRKTLLHRQKLDHNKVQETINYLKQAITIVELSKSHDRLSDLYGRLAGTQLYLPNQEEANKTYAKTLAMERDKNGFRTGEIFFGWGYSLYELQQYRLAAEKLNMAFKIAGALPPEKRGTMLADLLRMLAEQKNRQGNHKEGALLLKQSSAEIESQKKLKIRQEGPDFYHRM